MKALPGCVLIGLGTMLFVLMVVFPERLNVPALIGYLVAATFVLAGFLALANVFLDRKVRDWLAVALLSCMVVPSAWIAVGPGEPSCVGGFGGFIRVTGGGECRVAFGIAAVLGLAFIVIAVRYALQRDDDEG
ncbi:MAG: hypothetical protein K0S57_3511 [Ramlibacter sp.]|nr:hypothetical protein [Ramlibacter sp.]